MASVGVLHPSVIDTFPAAGANMREGSGRRQLRAELAEIQGFIRRSPFTDRMTQEISLWCRNFIQELSEHEDAEGVKREYIRNLQQLLIDPYFRVPLDMTSLLGSDGSTYTEFELRAFRRSMPESHQNRSPLDLENPAPLELTPHHVVRRMLTWLQHYGAYQHSNDLEETFNRFLPPLQPRPFARQASMERTAATYAILRQRDEARRHPPRPLAGRAQQDPAAASAAPDPFAAAQARLEAQAQEERRGVERLLAGMNRLERHVVEAIEEGTALDEGERAELEELGQRLRTIGRSFIEMAERFQIDHDNKRRDILAERERVEEALQQLRQLRAEAEQRGDALGTQIAQLCVELMDPLSGLVPKISKTEVRQEKLNEETNETAKAIEEKSKDPWPQIFRCIGIVITCIAATIVLNAVLHAAVPALIGVSSKAGWLLGGSANRVVVGVLPSTSQYGASVLVHGILI